MVGPSAPKFSDGEGYERMMGRWSRRAGADFLDWLELDPGLDLLDVGCGNGCFTSVVVERCRPERVLGIDPSAGQLDFARSRGLEGARFDQGDALDLPYGDGEFDAALMALSINFVSDPARAVSEMSRVVRRGGAVASYMWDIPGGGFPMETIRQALEKMGVSVPMPGAEITRLEAMRALWEEAALEEVEAKRIDTTLAYEDFTDFWDSNLGIPNSVANAVGKLAPAEAEELKKSLQALLAVDGDGRVLCEAHASAVKGRVP